MLAGLVVGYGVRAAPGRPRATGGRGRAAGRHRASASGWPATSTTRCCRCSASCSRGRRAGGAAARPADAGPARRRAGGPAAGAGLDRPGACRPPGRRRADLRRRQLVAGTPGSGVDASPARREPGAAAAPGSVGGAGRRPRAALDNVAQHAGDGAQAWVLLEDEPDAVTVTVRDDGAGFAPGRLEAAARGGPARRQRRRSGAGSRESAAPWQLRLRARRGYRGRAAGAAAG